MVEVKLKDFHVGYGWVKNFWKKLIFRSFGAIKRGWEPAPFFKVIFPGFFIWKFLLNCLGVIWGFQSSPKIACKFVSQLCWEIYLISKTEMPILNLHESKTSVDVYRKFYFDKLLLGWSLLLKPLQLHCALQSAFYIFLKNH